MRGRGEVRRELVWEVPDSATLANRQTQTCGILDSSSPHQTNTYGRLYLLPTLIGWLVGNVNGLMTIISYSLRRQMKKKSDSSSSQQL